jgi:hypothetical protein
MKAVVKNNAKLQSVLPGCGDSFTNMKTHSAFFVTCPHSESSKVNSDNV